MPSALLAWGLFGFVSEVYMAVLIADSAMTSIFFRFLNNYYGINLFNIQYIAAIIQT